MTQDRIDVYIIKRRLQRISDRIAGPGTVEAVLVQSVLDASRPAERPRK